MEKVYQIVVKGIASNKISVMNTTSYKEFKNFLREVQEENLHVVITTNHYFEDNGW